MRKIFPLIVICLFVSVLTKAQYADIPDSNFRSLLIQIYPVCFNGSGQLDTTCSGIINEDSLYCSKNSIKDLTGVQYFKSLTLLDCDSNQLTTLPTLPNKLQYLFCSYNQLTSLPALPNPLITLNCEYNQLTLLPALPNSLTSILCNENQLQHLPTLPASLQVLVCAFNQLQDLPTLPISLNSLDCGSNQLTTIPSLPNNLQYFYCYGNQLTVVPSLPSNLNLLDCDENNILSLPALPDSLNTLYCYTNLLTNLQRNLPIGLNYLNVGYNKISSLPGMDSLYQLQYLYCQGDSNLMCLPKLPNTLDSLNVSGTGVGCIPNNAGKNSIYPSGLPICNPTNNVNQCNAFPIVTGKVFFDKNSNGIKDNDEFYIPYIPVTLNMGETAFSNDKGQYTISVSNTGIFTLTPILPSFYKAVPKSISFGFSSYEEQLTVQDIAIQPNGIKDSLGISMTPWQDAIPGKRIAYSIAYRNLGTTQSEDTIRFTYDTSKLIFDSSSVPLLSNSGNTLIWLDTLGGSYFGNKYFGNGYQDPFIIFKVKTSVGLGETLQSATIIASATTSASYTDSMIIRGAYDPNNKQATPQLTTTQVANGNGIDYIIHFQNVGTDTANNIVIADTLSPLINPTVLQIVGDNPQPSFCYINNGIIYYQFLNVNLVDSSRSQLMSNGFVHFKLNPQLYVADGNVINNNASIYFDYNKPVVTNTATTLITNFPLPVSIANYQLKQINGSDIHVENDWTTANEQNTSYYNVQRSLDGINFTTLGKVVAKGSGANSYQFIDNSPANGINYYRLQIVDKNGTSSYSKVISIQLSINNYQLTIYPNPAKDFIIVKGKNIREINIFDNVGRLVRTQKGLNISNEQNKVTFNLQAGVYIIRLLMADGKIDNEKFVVE